MESDGTTMKQSGKIREDVGTSRFLLGNARNICMICWGYQLILYGDSTDVLKKALDRMLDDWVEL